MRKEKTQGKITGKIGKNFEMRKEHLPNIPIWKHKKLVLLLYLFFGLIHFLSILCLSVCYLNEKQSF